MFSKFLIEKKDNCEESESLGLETKKVSVQIANLGWFMFKRGCESMSESTRVFALGMDMFNAYLF